MEKLECTRCEQKWEREKARGRKPLFCPSCAEINKQEENEYIEKALVKKTEPIQESTKVYKFYIPAPSVWECDQCDISVKVNVGLTEIPTHACPKRRGIASPLAQKTREKTQRPTAVGSV